MHEPETSGSMEASTFDLFQVAEEEAGALSSAPRSFCHNVPHVRQCFNWDCGLACVLMILRALGACRQSFTTLRTLCPTTSIWSIDLAHLLRQFGLHVTFYTVTIGANPHYANEKFYMETMQEDEHRVRRLFQDAAPAGIHVEQRSVRVDELQQLLLSGLWLVLALVDKRQLVWAESGSRRGPSWGTSAEVAINQAVGTVDPVYTGHYIVLCGYCSQTDCFYAKDPAAEAETVSLPSGVVEVARRAFGTDEDLLLVALPQDCRQARMAARSIRQQ